MSLSLDIHGVTSVSVRITRVRNRAEDDEPFDAYTLTVRYDDGREQEISFYCGADADIGLDALLPIPGCDGEDMMPVEDGNAVAS